MLEIYFKLAVMVGGLGFVLVIAAIVADCLDRQPWFIRMCSKIKSL